MARNTSGLKRTAGPGRPKGSVNQTTRIMRDVARGLLEDPEYVRRLRARLIAGKAGRIEPLLYAYAYGKPKDTLVVEPGEIPPLVIEVMDWAAG
jgi:hypothetical protein